MIAMFIKTAFQKGLRSFLKSFTTGSKGCIQAVTVSAWAVTVFSQHFAATMCVVTVSVWDATANA